MKNQGKANNSFLKSKAVKEKLNKETKLDHA